MARVTKTKQYLYIAGCELELGEYAAFPAGSREFKARSKTNRLRHGAIRSSGDDLISRDTVTSLDSRVEHNNKPNEY